ncbi:hypothetical protein LINPERHAP1_LOCUS18616 [Linum perenne]
MEAVCRDRCGSRVYGNWNSRKDSFVLKCLGEKHTCPRALENKHAFDKWIATTYIEKFRITRKWDVSDMKRELQLTYGIRINDNKCYRARNEARILLEGTLEEEYKKLLPYVAALQNADPKGQFVLEVDVRAEDKVTFKRMYVGFSSLFKGLLAGCRPIIGFDGCFLRGSYRECCFRQSVRMVTTAYSHWHGLSLKGRPLVRGCGLWNLCKVNYVWIKGTGGLSFPINKR